MFNNFFRKSYPLWDAEKYGTARQATDIIRRMRIECWITRTTHIHSEYAILIAFSTATMVTRTHHDVTLYVYCVSCYSTTNCVTPPPPHKIARKPLISGEFKITYLWGISRLSIKIWQYFFILLVLIVSIHTFLPVVVHGFLPLHIIIF
jgi:hypothetical protein